jgi:hypothetical protein
LIKSFAAAFWLLALISFFPPAGVAQGNAAQQFAAADWFSRPLGAGVVWKYYHFDSLFGAPQDIGYIEADMDTPGVQVEMPYRNGLVKTSRLISGDFPAAAGGINGTFFAAGGHRTYLRVNGTEVPPAATWSNWGYQGGFVFNRNTDTYKVVARPKTTNGAETAQADWRSNANLYTDAMVNGPLLVSNGAITRSLYANLGSHCDARHPRTMVGMKPGNKLVLVVADGRHAGYAAGLTCEEMAQVMFALGCTDALSLDGGGSSLLYGRGEPFNGILNYPSDNGGWDHDPADERSVANAIAVIGNWPSPLPFDARVEVVSKPTTLAAGQAAWVSLKITNIGAQTWRDGRISITTSRPAMHVGRFYSSFNWPDTSTAWRLPQGSVVARGQSIQIPFQVRGPAVPASATVKETYQLTLDNTVRFGPPDDEISVGINVTPAPNDVLVESRTGGANYSWYSDTGMADAGAICSATGATPGIGTRYGSTLRSIAGLKSARWQPVFPVRGFYRVHVAWGDGGSRRSPVTYHVNHRAGRDTYQVSQLLPANEWLDLGTRTVEFDAGGGKGQGVEMTNENIDVSGNMYAGPVWFEYVGTSDVAGWELY